MSIKLSFEDTKKWKVKYIKYGFYSLCITLFLMPFPRGWSLYPLGVTLFLGMMAWFTDFGFYVKLFRQKMSIILPLITYFIIYASGLIIEFNLLHVIDKLMFLLVPILAIPILMDKDFLKRIHIILLFFVAGIIIISIFQFSRAAFESFSIENGVLKFQPFISPGVSRFNWEHLSTFEHPTYIAIKTLWAFTLILFAGEYFKVNRFLQIVFVTVFSIFIYFLAVRAGLLIIILLIIWFIFKMIKKKAIKILFILLAPFIFLLIFRIMMTNERTNYWYDHLFGRVLNEKVDWINIEPRTRSWYSSVNLIKEKPLFGIGLNSRDKLAEEHRRQGFNVEADFRLNSHNQFLETQLAFGIPGTLILLWMLLTPLIKRRSSWNPDLIIPFLIIVCVSMLFESILVRQWGIMFFVLFYCILLIPDKPGSEQKCSV